MLSSLGLQAEPVDTAEVPFGEWLPDQPERNNPGAVEALNVIPEETSYGPFCQHNPQTNLLPSTARGAIGILLPTNVVQVYAGSVNGVYTRFGGGVFTSLSSDPTSDDFAYEFVRVGDVMVAIHKQLVPQKTPVGSSTALVDVGGSPPTANCGAQVGDFLMLGNLEVDPDDSGGQFPSRVRWGGFNNIDQPWVTDPATQADFQDMPAEGGPVTAISGREVGVIFQERMISRARYVGPPSIFEFTVAEDKRGCIARDSVVDVGYQKFFIAEDGFFAWNGVNAQSIGDARVNNYFFKRLNYAQRSRIVGAADFVNGCVVWAFPTSTSGILDEFIIYSYRHNKWSHSIQTAEYIFSAGYSNLSSEELTDPAESYTVSFDTASLYGGGRARLAGFNTSHAYGLFDGPNMAATIDTGEFSGPNSRRVDVTNARPLVDVTSPVATMQPLMRDQGIGQNLAVGDEVAQEVDGTCPIMGDARFMRFRVNLPVGASWKHAMGVEIARRTTGVF